MDNNSKTPYEWCIDNEVRVTGLEQHPKIEEHFYTQELDMSYNDINAYVNSLGQKHKDIKVIEGKLHLKPVKYLELRMYSLVPYNILGIQMGIQHEHSVVQNVVNNVISKIIAGEEMDEKFKLWATEWNTSILLNGGTSNEGHKVRHGFRDIWYVGTMQQNLEKLKEAGINFSTFYEPDLNSMLTGISFIVDERVFLRRLYKDYVNTPKWWESRVDNEPWAGEIERWEKENAENRIKWVEKIGGEKNDFLRTFLKGFSLAKG